MVFQCAFAQWPNVLYRSDICFPNISVKRIICFDFSHISVETFLEVGYFIKDIPPPCHCDLKA